MPQKQAPSKSAAKGSPAKGAPPKGAPAKASPKSSAPAKAAAGVKAAAPVKGPVKPAPGPEPEWRKALYAPARVSKWVRGEMTLQELHGITGPEMLEMAVTGFSMYEQGRYQQAKVIFDGLAALDPAEAYYRTALGAVFLAEGKLDDAIAVLTQAIGLDAKDLAAYVNRGEAHLRKSDLIPAALDFKKAVELDPQAKDPLTRRARALSAAVIKSIEEIQAHGGGAAKGGSKPQAKPAPSAAKGKPGKR